MHATLSFRSIPRTLRSGFLSLVRSRTSSRQRRVKENEEFCILESTSEDVSATTLPSNADTTPYLLLRDSPLASLELALLCTAQGIAIQPQKSQTAVLEVIATKATVIQIGEPLPAEAQVAIIDTDAEVRSASISVTLPAFKKTAPSEADSVAPLLPLQDITSTLRTSGNCQDGKKKVSRRHSADKENLSPASRHTEEELRKECIPRVYPSRPTLRRCDALIAKSMR